MPFGKIIFYLKGRQYPKWGCKCKYLWNYGIKCFETLLEYSPAIKLATELDAPIAGKQFFGFKLSF